MSLFTTLYIVLISVSYTIAFIHLLTWLQVKKKVSCLLFTVVALSAGTLSILELQMLRLSDISVYENYIKFYHIPLYIFLVSVVWFIAVKFQVYRKWMAVLFTTLWTVSLLLNFMGEGSLTYNSLTSLTDRIAFNGEVYTVVRGNLNPLRLIADVASILFFIFVIDASIRQYKRGYRQSAISIGGSTALFMLISGIVAPMADLGLINVPPMVSAPFIFIVLAMSFELKSEIVESSELTATLKNEKNKWKGLLRDINLPVLSVDKNGMVSFVNEALLNILDCKYDEVIGENWLEKFIPKNEQDILVKEFPMPLKEGFSIHFKNSVLSKSGKKHLLYWSNVGVYNQDDEFIGITSIANDITARDDAFKEILELKEKLELENEILKENADSSSHPEEIICHSDTIKYAFNKAQQVSEVDSTVLLEGETGVGKGVFANYIHKTSKRNKNPFISVNCAAIPGELLESELFGYSKGAFTGATKDKKGRFELADRGTLFLDEIAELPLELQPKLLRVLQDGCFEKLGGEKTIKVDVRLITATNKLLHEQVKNKLFREDLFYRLNVFPITIPPLRKRQEDISFLIDHFVLLYVKKYNKAITKVSKQTYLAFAKHSWPGNIRELQNLIERAVISSKGEVLKTNGLLSGTQSSATKNVLNRLEDVERLHIVNILNTCNWQIHGGNGAAVLLDINPNTLRSRMKKLGIQKSITVNS